MATHTPDSALDELGELELPGTPEEADLPATGPHARALAGAPQGRLDTPLYGPDALSNLWGATEEPLGPPPQGSPDAPGIEAPYVPGAGAPAAGEGGVVDTALEPSDVNRQQGATVPELVVRHIVETTSKGAPDFRIFRVPVGPFNAGTPGGQSPQPTIVLDANPLRNRALIRNVSATAVSIFIVRAGTGGNGAYLNMGYRLQQNGETLEIDSSAGVEAYCTAFGDAGTLQVVEEFGANADGSVEVPI